MLFDEGHIDGMCRAAVRAGLAVEDALVLASHNGAVHGLDEVGAIAPGYRADFAVLPDATFRPSRVYKDGRVVAIDGEAVPDRHADAARMDRGHGPHRPSSRRLISRSPPAVPPCE